MLNHKIKTALLGLIMLVSASNAMSQSQIRFYTSMGEFDAVLYDTLMPITAGNFYTLVNQKYYDGIIFHRIIDGFVIQGGDPTGTGAGGPGYSIPDEFDEDLSNIRQTLSMANSGPNSGGSQFFINLVNNTQLDFDKAPLSSAHPVFGIVTDGWPIVQNIGRVDVNDENRPLTDVVMDSVRVISSPFTGIADRKTPVTDFKVFPNPVNNESAIAFKSSISGFADVSIMDQTGKRILVKTITIENGLNIIPFEELLLSPLQTGVYHIAVQTDKELVGKKFVVLGGN